MSGTERNVIEGEKVLDEAEKKLGAFEWTVEEEAPDPKTDRVYRTFETAQKTLAGILSGPNFNVMIVNAMQTGKQTTLGKILVDEAWDMAECLVDKMEQMLSEIK